MRIEIRELVEVLGKELAHSDDEMQGKFLNMFAYEISVCCDRGRKSEQQLCYLSDKLDKNGEQLILDLAEFVKIRREKRPI